MNSTRRVLVVCVCTCVCVSCEITTLCTNWQKKFLFLYEELNMFSIISEEPPVDVVIVTTMRKTTTESTMHEIDHSKGNRCYWLSKDKETGYVLQHLKMSHFITLALPRVTKLIHNLWFGSWELKLDVIVIVMYKATTLFRDGKQYRVFRPEPHCVRSANFVHVCWTKLNKC